MGWFDAPVVVRGARLVRFAALGQGRGVHQIVDERKLRNRESSRRYQAKLRRELRQARSRNSGRLANTEDEL